MKSLMLLSLIFAAPLIHADALTVLAVGLSNYGEIHFQDIQVEPANAQANDNKAEGDFKVTIFNGTSQVRCHALITHEFDDSPDIRHSTLSDCQVNNVILQEGYWMDFYTRVSPELQAVMDGLHHIQRD